MFAKAFLLVAAMLPGLALAADPPVVRLPEVVVISTPGTAVKLTSDTLYVFDADTDCLVTTSPPGILAVTKESGPVKIKGVFSDGTGKTETRTYKGKWVWTVDVVATGMAELLVIPAGVTTEAGIHRRMIDASAGPRPPPGPGPNPPPPPPPPVLTPFQVKLQAAWIADGANADSKARYAAFYKQAAIDAQDTAYTTAGQLNDVMMKVVKTMKIPPGSLNNTANAVNVELLPLLPKSPATPMDAATRKLYADTYNRIAQDLEVIK